MIVGLRHYRTMVLLTSSANLRGPKPLLATGMALVVIAKVWLARLTPV
ncbi:hypothetical protein ACWDKQ_31740 [Saccharopolyspora sp. NPDC000995]